MKALVNNSDELTKYVPRIFLNKEGQPDLSSSIFLSCHAIIFTVDASRNQKYSLFSVTFERASFLAFSKSLKYNQLKLCQSIII
jgi:hypothetical protein